MKLPTKTNERPLKTVVINRQETLRTSEERVNIVLTPAYYWFKSEVLPVSNVSQAKKLVASLFDGVIPEGEYSYYVIKKEERFWLFAYSDAMIVAKLTQLGLKPSQINNIYFAQTECELTEMPLMLDDGFVLMAQEESVSLVPSAYVADTISSERYFSAHHFSKHTVSLSFFQNSFLEEKYLYRMMAVAIAFIVLYFGHYLMVRQELRDVLGRQLSIAEHFKLPQTSFELNGLKNALYAKESRQFELRENVKKLLSLKLNPGEYVKKMQINQKTGSFEIVLTDAKHAEALKSQLQQSFKITSVKVVDTTFYVGVSL